MKKIRTLKNTDLPSTKSFYLTNLHDDQNQKPATLQIESSLLQTGKQRKVRENRSYAPQSRRYSNALSKEKRCQSGTTRESALQPMLGQNWRRYNVGQLCVEQHVANKWTTTRQHYRRRRKASDPVTPQCTK